MKQKRFYSYALATSLLISSFGGLVNVSAATYQDAEEVKAQEHVSIMKMDASNFQQNHKVNGFQFIHRQMVF